MFLNKSKINKFSSNGKVWCWIHEVEEQSKSIVIQTIKFASGSLMIWKCICIHRLGMIHKLKVTSINKSWRNNFMVQFVSLI
jgi:hypothetical protein